MGIRWYNSIKTDNIHSMKTSSYTRNKSFAGSSLPAETKALRTDRTMDRRTDGPTDQRTDGRTDGRTKPLIELRVRN